MRLAFVEIGVRNLEASLRWYAALGLAVEVHDVEGGFALLHDGHGGRVALKQREAATARLQFEVPNLAAELARLGSDAAVKSSAEGYRRATLHDPDGHAVALFERVPPCG